MLPRRAAKEGKAKTKVLFDQMSHQRGYSYRESSRASSRGAECDENKVQTVPSTSSLAGSSSKGGSQSVFGNSSC